MPNKGKTTKKKSSVYMNNPPKDQNNDGKSVIFHFLSIYLKNETNKLLQEVINEQAKQRTELENIRKLLEGVVKGLDISQDASTDCVYKYEGETAVFISDMSGFTTTTRKYGIVHFASLILKMRSILTPILKQYNAHTIFPEADDMWVTFTDTETCVRCALDCTNAIEKYNNSVEDKWKLSLSGVGIHAGPGVVGYGHEGKMYGETVDRAFVLGEDTCEKGEVLITDYVYEKLKDILPSDLSYVKNESEETGVYYHIDGNLKDYVKCEEEAPSSPTVGQFLARNEEGADLETMDKQLTETFMVTRTVVMYGATISHITQKYGIEEALVLKEKTCSLIKPIWDKWSGKEMEENFFTFEKPTDAIAACIEVRDVISQYNNANKDEKSTIQLRGFGIHSSEMLIVPTTDVHWGDAVNTASKLGEDLAENADVLVSAHVHEKIKDLPIFANISWEEKKLAASKADLTCFSATGKLNV